MSEEKIEMLTAEDFENQRKFDEALEKKYQKEYEQGLAKQKRLEPKKNQTPDYDVENQIPLFLPSNKEDIQIPDNDEAKPNSKKAKTKSASYREIDEEIKDGLRKLNQDYLSPDDLLYETWLVRREIKEKERLKAESKKENIIIENNKKGSYKIKEIDKSKGEEYILPEMKDQEYLENLVVQSNELVESTNTLTLNEIKFFEMCVSQVDSREILEKDALFTLKLDDITDLFYQEKNKENRFRDIRKVCKLLYERSVVKKYGDSEQHIRLISMIYFDHKNYVVQVRFAPDIIPYISQLQNHFTRYRLKYSVYFKSKHSHKLYTLALMWIANSKDGHKEIEIEKLKKVFCPNSNYQTAGFLRRVIKPAIEEINSFTDLTIEFIPQKHGKEIYALQFRIERKIRNAYADNFITQQKYFKKIKANRTYKRELNKMIEYLHKLPDNSLIVDDSDEYIKQGNKFVDINDSKNVITIFKDLAKAILDGNMVEKSKLTRKSKY